MMRSDDLPVTLGPNGYRIFNHDFAFTNEMTRQQAFQSAQQFGLDRLVKVEKQAGRPLNYREKITGCLYTPQAAATPTVPDASQSAVQTQLDYWRNKPASTPAEATRKQNRIDMYQRLADERSAPKKSPDSEPNN